jgi:hypothetical protein
VSRRNCNNVDDPVAGYEWRPVWHHSINRWLVILLAAFAIIDTAILFICPNYRGDCLYGFFTFIAFPVMLSGPVGLLTPRFALRHGRHWQSRTFIWISGGLLLIAAITICHAIAIRLLNFEAYGDILIRYRLLIVELCLALAYYTGLSIIAFVKAPTATDRD